MKLIVLLILLGTCAAQISPNPGLSGGTGSGTATGTGTTNKLPCWINGGAGVLGDCNETDDGTSFKSGAHFTIDIATGNINIDGVISTGGASLTNCSAATGCWAGTEGAAAAGSANVDVIYFDSTAHRPKMKNNNGSAVQIVGSGADINTSDQVTVTHLAAALPAAQGGTDVTTATNNTVLVATGSVRAEKTLPNCTDTAGNHLNFTQSTNAFSCGTSSSGAGLQTITMWYSPGSGGATATAAVAQNATKAWGLYVNGSISTSAFCYDVTTADNTANVYDMGIYDSTGATLIVHTGATAGTTLFPSTGLKCASWSASGTVSGKVYFVLTSSGATPAAILGALNTQGGFANGVSVGSTSGGALASSITPPADSFANSQILNLFFH